MCVVYKDLAHPTANCSDNLLTEFMKPSQSCSSVGLQSASCTASVVALSYVLYKVTVLVCQLVYSEASG